MAIRAVSVTLKRREITPLADASCSNTTLEIQKLKDIDAGMRCYMFVR